MPKRSRVKRFDNGYGLTSLISGTLLVIVGVTMYLSALFTKTNWVDSLWFYVLLSTFCCLMPLIFMVSFTSGLIGASRDRNKVLAFFGVLMSLIYLILAFLALAEEADIGLF